MTSSTGGHPATHEGDHSSSMTCPRCGTRFPPLPPTAAPVGLPDATEVRPLVERAIRVLFEVVDGRRVPRTVANVVSPSVLGYLRVVAVSRRPARVARLQSLRLCRPTEQAVEAAAVVLLDGRARAVAARFEHEQTTWRCVALRIL